MNIFQVSVISFVALLTTCPLAAQAAPAGSVIFVKGTVSAEREPPVSLAKGDDVLVDDTIVTGVASRAQLLMLDGAKIAIRPNSRLKIEEFAFSQSDDAGAQANIETVKDRSVMSLIKGGFRTITGAIGKSDETANEVRTPVGVLGIRGTDYTAILCDGDCQAAPGVSPNEPIADGLYLGVMLGTIFFRNEFGEFDIDAGEYAFISMSDRTLRQLSVPPNVFLDRYDVVIGEDAAGQPGANTRTPLRFDGKLGVRRDPGKPDLDDDGLEKNDPQNQETPAQPILGIDADGNVIDLTPGDVPQ